MKAILLLLGSLVLLAIVFLSGVIITANVIAEPEPHKFANIETPDLWTSKPKEVDTAKQAYERLPDAPAPVVAAAEAPKPAAPSAPLGQSAHPVAAVSPSAVNGAVDQTVTASVQPAAPGAPMPGSLPQPIGAAGQMPPAEAQPVTPQGANVDAAHAQFCYARYRSYRVEDNTYQPFDGSPRRQCQAPGAPQVDTAAPAQAAREPMVRDVASAPIASSPRIQGQDRPKRLAPLPPEAMPSDDDWQAIEAGIESRNDDPQVIQSAAPTGSNGGGSHEAWCANRYQSYRADDNSYRPFDGGPRRTCQSPFG
ncbi:BA14K family protein [Rhizobium sp. XQZ8]|uniref:BA14K family protein n=1 Tax=Rhizobium populisoli TaxID=2859785 RepID=UPI001CA50F60|nr:BA14K family protein [Rhizobium populisoli]MBW6424608.1 BA14K family protein [Rhizobium populisoli]